MIYSRIKRRCMAFAADETAGTAIEYGLIAGLISAALLATLASVNESMTAMYAYIGNAIIPALGG